ncbi:serine/threonine-protein phosphatase 6 regulatory subunit 3 isoform X1 [Cucumis melo var. makuwa]|uniref:Serine/threonine-protein phosphatase 6 regulatory subunit 3 isoform X1 n=1 Tax=Cucumis melo var. makuwa TaxID=1194695 RepID=A0A5A7UJ58_CUCMM|nr:serine/threonine-protein phosphatase 6 regulatory subunit 3 isoform X1 [Cucumis melo var. makuwa]
MSNRRKPLRRRTPSAKNPSAEERCQPTTPLSKNSKIHDPSAKELEELDLPKSFSSSSQSVLLKTGNVTAEKELINSDTIKRVIDLFFEYPCNNFLHHHVENIVLSCLESKKDDIVDHLLRECNLIGKIIQTEKNPIILVDSNQLGKRGSNLTEEELETHTISTWKEGKAYLNGRWMDKEGFYHDNSFM